MARRELSPAQLALTQAITPWLDEPDLQIVVACSGGPDSMALAGALAWLSAREPLLAGRASACIVDHGLQVDSGHVAARVATLLNERGLPTRIHPVEVDQTSASGPEAAAREARYVALARDRPGSRVLLGHTLDDQAETVLLGLARGSGTRSLAGMAAQFSRGGTEFVRPLLGLRREIAAAACRDWQLPAWHDPHNVDKRFTRVRVRTSVLPTLEAELGPGIAEALARTAKMARADADLLDELAGEHAPIANSGLAVDRLRGLPRALASRVLRSWLIAGGIEEPSHGHLEAVWELVDQWRGQQGVDLPAGRRVVRRQGRLFVELR